jgi:hypothetical protein
VPAPLQLAAALREYRRYGSRTIGSQNGKSPGRITLELA